MTSIIDEQNRRLMRDIVRTGRQMSDKTRRAFCDEFDVVASERDPLQSAYFYCNLLLYELERVEKYLGRHGYKKAIALITANSFPWIYGRDPVPDAVLYRLRDTMAALICSRALGDVFPNEEVTA